MLRHAVYTIWLVAPFSLKGCLMACTLSPYSYPTQLCCPCAGGDGYPDPHGIPQQQAAIPNQEPLCGGKRDKLRREKHGAVLQPAPLGWIRHHHLRTLLLFLFFVFYVYSLGVFLCFKVRGRQHLAFVSHKPRPAHSLPIPAVCSALHMEHLEAWDARRGVRNSCVMSCLEDRPNPRRLRALRNDTIVFLCCFFNVVFHPATTDVGRTPKRSHLFVRYRVS